MVIVYDEICDNAIIQLQSATKRSFGLSGIGVGVAGAIATRCAAAADYPALVAVGSGTVPYPPPVSKVKKVGWALVVILRSPSAEGLRKTIVDKPGLR